ncbi:flippase [Haloplasma contractile]|uniref:Membrane protein n=1 Tax=Haloplasma contractile SSD-17B TaxID=1033810 RepID=U2FI84_9MOLU|nr:flippase [Haloplasma contractile]ERJ10934.1 Membrane protein [Haloplasma contractile SSD-17B]
MSYKARIKKLKDRLQANKLATRIIQNSRWLVVDKLFTMVIGVFVTAIVARYFGPERYGQYNYALSFVTLFTAFSTLGLETLSVKAIVDENYDEGTILCTSLVMRVIGGSILTIVAIIIINIIDADDRNLHIIVFILSITMVFKAIEVIEYWIQAHHKAKISSIIRMISYIIMVVMKIVLVLLGGTLIHFSLIYMVNAIIIGIGLFIAYSRNREVNIKWRIDFKYAKSVLSQSWYLVLAGLMGTLYMKIDKVMLGSLMGTTLEVGMYSAATSIAEMWYFVPLAIITSFRPIIMNNKSISKLKYEKSVLVQYTIITWLSIAFGFFMLIFSDLIIDLLYGQDYYKAAKILSISVWAGIFAMIGSASSTWLITERLHKYKTIFVFSGAVVNIALNLFLIPRFGGYGAAIATLASQFIANIFTPLFFTKMRPNIIMIFKAVSLYILRKNKK